MLVLALPAVRQEGVCFVTDVDKTTSARWKDSHADDNYSSFQSLQKKCWGIKLKALLLALNSPSSVASH